MVNQAGHRCYAEKQMDYWSSLAEEARDARTQLQGALLKQGQGALQPEIVYS